VNVGDITGFGALEIIRQYELIGGIHVDAQGRHVRMLHPLCRIAGIPVGESRKRYCEDCDHAQQR
jgi:hypothetical protein